jgi:hypothetical protein
MKIIKWLLVLMLAGFTHGQGNLIFTPGTCISQDSITIDLDYDVNKTLSEYGAVTQQEARAIAMVRNGTWTNDSLQVYAAVDPDSTYYPVYFDDAVLTLVATTGSDYIVFDPRHFAGIRYLMFVMPANEGATRVYTIVRRRY